MMDKEKILVWLPSPLGDAVLCTPALRAIRGRFRDKHITFCGNMVVKQVLDGAGFCDGWIRIERGFSPRRIMKLRGYGFAHAILFKNSFESALDCALAGIPVRTGYVRDGRGWLLTDKLYPEKDRCGKFKTTSMVDYYLAVASWLGCETEERQLELRTDPRAEESLVKKMQWLKGPDKPLVILVPGGAFGPSKCWQTKRFAAVADGLIDKFAAKVVVSVSPDKMERRIAAEICQAARHELVNLGESPVSLAELKCLFSRAAVVITNDTGPRHIAIALGKKVVTLFGPNNPAWTETNYEKEIKIIGMAECVPCDKPVCRLAEHVCMESITVEMVLDAAEKHLSSERLAGS